MASINISIRKEAYEFLKSFKRNDESFSDIILEFKENSYRKRGSKESIMRFFGTLKNENINWDENEKRMKEFRKSFEDRINETSEKMEKARKNDLS
jgi:predicted CopG family antitoxin